ncbi:hypothetical protein VIGAN_05281100 [Vigna angularis var. angularis]|uniref:Uncharacterized protein n=1 Tax=Vigna angularis var. angularis TaxID=157739 RepID=A0A0S3S8E5_PHAAN|nr:hypothetical protein VIGAN_05281100 [Vigna angularis var. angularis]
MKFNKWSYLPDFKKGKEMEGRINMIERMVNEHGRALEDLRDGHQELTEIIRVLMKNSKKSDRSSEDSQGSVNGERLGRKDEVEEEMKEEKGEIQRGWMKRVELPTFEGVDPVGWIYGTSSDISTTRNEGPGTLGVSKIGSNMARDNRSRGIRNLPYLEYIHRREKGRCFHCGSLYSLDHRCPERSMRILIMAKCEEEGEGEEEVEMEQKCMELSVFSAGGLT